MKHSHTPFKVEHRYDRFYLRFKSHYFSQFVFGGSTAHYKRDKDVDSKLLELRRHSFPPSYKFQMFHLAIYNVLLNQKKLNKSYFMHPNNLQTRHTQFLNQYQYCQSIFIDINSFESICGIETFFFSQLPN